MIGATDKLSVTLEAGAWEAVMRIMAKAPVPYETVAPLIQRIQEQCVAGANGDERKDDGA